MLKNLYRKTERIRSKSLLIFSAVQDTVNRTLKTPLTVIQGNIDLINETELDDEQRLYAGYITESSEQIGIYIKVLIDISRTIAGYQLHLEKFDIADYMSQIKAQASSLCLTKGICLQLETGANQIGRAHV